MIRLILLALAAAIIQHSTAFYLPGLAPKAFCNKNKATETCKVLRSFRT